MQNLHRLMGEATGVGSGGFTVLLFSQKLDILIAFACYIRPNITACHVICRPLRPDGHGAAGFVI